MWWICGGIGFLASLTVTIFFLKAMGQSREQERMMRKNYMDDEQ